MKSLRFNLFFQLFLLVVPFSLFALEPTPTMTWEKIVLPFEASKYNLRVVWLYNPYSKSVFVGEDKKGLFQSKDGGKSWSRTDDGSFQADDSNNDFNSLQFGKDALFSITQSRNGTRIFQSDNGKIWLPLWPHAGIQADEGMGWGNRLWVDHKKPSSMYAMTVKYGYESSEVLRQLWHTDNSWMSFEKINISNEWAIGSVDIYNGRICIGSGAEINCSSDNGVTWVSLSLAPIADSMAKDKEVNSEPLIDIDKTNEELLIQSAGKLYQTKNSRKIIEEKIHLNGRLFNLIFHPIDTYPAYGIFYESDDNPWKVLKINASGSINIFPGPKDKGFRLKSVDFSNSTLLIWASSETFRGVLK